MRIEDVNAFQSVYGFIRDSKATHSARKAMIYCGRTIDFPAFFSLIEKARTALRSFGLKKGDVITLQLPNIPQNVIIFYAAAAENLVLDIIHPLTPLRQTAESMKETGSRFLVTSDNVLLRGDEKFFASDIKIAFCRISAYAKGLKKLVIRFKTGGTKLLGGFIDFDRLISVSEECGDEDRGSDDVPCCILHSGGTTAQPKKIVLSHHALNCMIQRRHYIVSGTDLSDKVCLSVLPSFHGFGLCMNVHASSALGMTQLIMPKFRSREAVRLIKKYKAFMLSGVPAIFYGLMKVRSFDPRHAGSLKRCFVGGDNVSDALVRRFNKCVTGSEDERVMFQGYGMTECVAVCALNVPDGYREGTVGRAIPGVDVEVVRDGKIMPRGTEGELCVAGNILMNGYFKDEEGTANAEVFVDGKRFIRSGDWGLVDEDGFVRFKQRIKHVIMRKGVNVFPAEVENVIGSLPYVEKCCVVGKIKGNENTQTVYAYVKLRDKNFRTEETKEEIKKYAAKHLIRYAVPETVIFTATFPRTPVGKIDTKYFENRND